MLVNAYRNCSAIISLLNIYFLSFSGPPAPEFKVLLLGDDVVDIELIENEADRKNTLTENNIVYWCLGSVHDHVCKVRNYFYGLLIHN